MRKIYKISLVVIGMIFLLMSDASATTANINTAQDTYIITSGNNNIPVPTNDLLVTNVNSLGGFSISPPIVSKVLLKFDLTNIPKGAIINSATFTMNVDSNMNSGTIGVSLLDNNVWDKSSTTIPVGTLTLLSSQPITAQGKVSWDVTSGISPSVITLLLEEPNIDNLVATLSSSGSTPDKVPVLTISYTEPTPPPVIGGSPNITSSSPESPLVSKVNDSVDFNIEINQSVNAVWSMDGTVVKSENNMVASEYNNSDAIIGGHTVDVKVSNSNGSDSFEWNWTVENVTPPPENVGIINGVVFNDRNHNNEKDEGERGISGARIQLKGIDENNKNIVITKKTRRNGRYSFNNLSLGQYILKSGRKEITVYLTDDNVQQTVNFGRRYR
jgi:hypothetical protein